MLTRCPDGLQTLAADIHAVRRRASDQRTMVTQVAARLSEVGSESRWLADRYRVTAADSYAQHVIYVAPDGGFSIVAMAWRPGQCTPIHSHRSWCAVGIYEGAECERRYRLDRTDQELRLFETETRVLQAGQAVAMLPEGDDIHRVTNCNTDLTISLHVYGLDITRAGSSIKSRFDDVTIAS